MRSSKQLTKFEQQQIAQREQLYLNWALTIGKTYGVLLGDSEAGFKEYLKQTVLMSLDALHQFVLIEKAKSLMTGISGGIWGIAAAVAKVAAIELAYQGVRSVVSKSMYDGGFAGHTGAGGKYEKKQLVQLHGSEYVVPMEGTSNPSVKQVIDIMEVARRNGTINSLNLPAAVAASNGGAQASGSDPELKALIAMNIKSNQDTQAAVNELREKGTYTRLYGKKGFYDADSKAKIQEQGSEL